MYLYIYKNEGVILHKCVSGVLLLLSFQTQIQITPVEMISYSWLFDQVQIYCFVERLLFLSLVLFLHVCNCPRLVQAGQMSLGGCDLHPDRVIHSVPVSCCQGWAGSGQVQQHKNCPKNRATSLLLAVEQLNFTRWQSRVKVLWEDTVCYLHLPQLQLLVGLHHTTGRRK